MSKQDIYIALSTLETALSVIRDNVVMPVSGNIYPFYQEAKSTLKRATEAMEQLHEHPYVASNERDYDSEPPTACYCNATNFPPCGFCTKEVDTAVTDMQPKDPNDGTSGNSKAPKNAPKTDRRKA